MHAGGARFLRQARDQFFHLFADRHHHVGEFVDDHDDIRQRHERRDLVVLEYARVQRIRDRLLRLDRVLDLAVVAADVAHAERGHEPVATLHLSDTPAQGVGGLLHVRHHRREQRGDPFVDRQLEHLRVDHDQAHVCRRRLVQQAQDHRVQRDGLARAGGAGDEQVRHAREVDDDRFAADVLAERQGQLRLARVVFLRIEDFAEADDLAALVRNLEADDGFARNHLDDAHADRRQRTRKVFRQVRDPARLDARAPASARNA